MINKLVCLYGVLNLILIPINIEDCNKNLNCCKEVLEKKEWIFIGSSEPLNWPTECRDYIIYKFIFKDNHLQIKQTVNNCNKIEKERLTTKDVYQTNYKLIKGKFDQVYVRIFKTSEQISRLLSTFEGGKNGSICDSVDYQFLYKDTLILRANSKLKIGKTYENKFK